MTASKRNDWEKKREKKKKGKKKKSKKKKVVEGGNRVIRVRPCKELRRKK